MKPLEGLKVIELARILAAPWAGQTLSDLGAEVIKIESPDGDDTRKWGPPWIGEDAAYFHAANRGKESRVIDFKTKQGQDELLSLIKDADVLIENFKTGGLAKYGLDFETLHQKYPRLIYCSVTGFGHSGPMKNLAGYDLVVQGLSGIMDVTGLPDGPPMKIGVGFADIFTGLYSVIGIQAALHMREKTGRGQHIDMALYDCMVGVMANQAQNYLATGETPKRLGNAHQNIVPYEVFEAKDGYFILAVGNDKQFRDFSEIVETQWHEDARFKTNALRIANRDALIDLINSKTRLWMRDVLLETLAQGDVPASPIQTVEEALTDPQILSRNMVITPKGTTNKYVRTPLTFSEAELALDKPAPKKPSA